MADVTPATPATAKSASNGKPDKPAAKADAKDKTVAKTPSKKRRGASTADILGLISLAKPGENVGEQIAKMQPSRGTIKRLHQLFSDAGKPVEASFLMSAASMMGTRFRSHGAHKVSKAGTVLLDVSNIARPGTTVQAVAEGNTIRILPA